MPHWAQAQGRIADAIPHVSTLCAAEQQVLPAALADPLAAAFAAWDAGRAEDALQNLKIAVESAQMTKFV